MLKLLLDTKHSDIIRWNTNPGEFKLIDPKMVSKMWGKLKDNDTMDYPKFGRSMRYSYKRKILAKVPKKMYTFKFLFDLNGLNEQNVSGFINKISSQVGSIRSKCHNLSK